MVNKEKAFDNNNYKLYVDDKIQKEEMVEIIDIGRSFICADETYNECKSFEEKPQYDRLGNSLI